ncbi:homoserine kinase [Janibacter sp. GXQ6167]|uniref:homoserine kinase n=1 Tax=Janibacter sp. GXQ6167 TaxID=3240791 RepID=UPI0035267561
MRLAPGTSAAVRTPASSANLGPGFDSVGLALGLWDECRVTVTEEPGLVIEVEGEAADKVPRDARHLVYRSMLTAFGHLDITPPSGLHLVCRNGVPHGRGLGSSATAIVTGIYAAQLLAARAEGGTGTPDLAVTNRLASALEGHPDNASASVFGGATLSVMTPVDGELPVTETVALRLHEAITVVVCVPDGQLSTEKARSVLPGAVPLATAAASTARGALLIHALTTDPALLMAGTVDVLHQEARRPAYPDSMALVDRLRGAGLAATISGAGPSVVVLVADEDGAARVAGLTPSHWKTLTPGVPTRGVAPI